MQNFFTEKILSVKVDVNSKEHSFQLSESLGNEQLEQI